MKERQRKKGEINPEEERNHHSKVGKPRTKGKG